MTNEQKAREITWTWRKEHLACTQELTDRANEGLVCFIAQALDAKDAQIKELREALEFYAAPDNWQYGFFARSKSTPPIIEQDVEHETSVPGKRAREALSKLKETP